MASTLMLRRSWTRSSGNPRLALTACVYNRWSQARAAWLMSEGTSRALPAESLGPSFPSRLSHTQWLAPLRAQGGKPLKRGVRALTGSGFLDGRVNDGVARGERKQHSRSASPTFLSPFCFPGRQLFHGWQWGWALGWEGGFQDDSKCITFPVHLF